MDISRYVLITCAPLLRDGARLYWRPNRSGYTAQVHLAGVYDSTDEYVRSVTGDPRSEHQTIPLADVFQEMEAAKSALIAQVPYPSVITVPADIADAVARAKATSRLATPDDLDRAVRVMGEGSVPGQITADMRAALSTHGPDIDPALLGPPIKRTRERVDDYKGFPRFRSPDRVARIEVDGKRPGGCRVRFSVMGRRQEIVVSAKDHDREPLRDEESLRDIIRGELEAWEVCPTDFEIIPGLK